MKRKKNLNTSHEVIVVSRNGSWRVMQVPAFHSITLLNRDLFLIQNTSPGEIIVLNNEILERTRLGLKAKKRLNCILQQIRSD